MKNIFINICDDKESLDLISNNDVIDISTVNDVKELFDNCDLENCNFILRPLTYDECFSISPDEFKKNVEEIVEFFKENNANLILGFMNFEIEKIIEYIDEYPIFKDVKYHVFLNDHRPISYDELLVINNYTTLIANYVKRFNLSPFEQTIFLSDLIRELEYKQYDYDDINISISRDLIEVITKDYIVCEGYANIFCGVLEKLGMISSVFHYYHDDITNIPDEKQNMGHATVTVLIDDDKYNIHDELAYDLTWSSKYKNNYYLEDYRFIAIPKKLDMKIKGITKDYDGYESSINSYADNVMNRIKGLKKIMDYDNQNSVCGVFYNNVIKEINKFVKVSNALTVEEFAKENDVKLDDLSYQEKYELLLKYYDTFLKDYMYEVPVFVFTRALYNVKRIEKSIDKDKYESSYVNLKKIIYNRFKYLKIVKNATTNEDLNSFKPISQVDILMSKLLDEKIYPDDFEEEFYKALEDEEKRLNNMYEDDNMDSLFKDTKMMSLLSLFRKLANEDTENPVKKGRKIK